MIWRQSGCSADIRQCYVEYTAAFAAACGLESALSQQSKAHIYTQHQAVETYLRVYGGLALSS